MIRKLLIACILMLAMSGYAMAGITAEEAAKLNGPDLTWAGAEKAGSADGLVPAWTGGITKGPDGWYYEGKLKVPFSKFDPKKSGLRPDPFADDKILFTVTAQNMAQYADKLSAGQKAVLAKYPEVKFNVYPSRRSMGYSPDFQANAKKIAVSAKLLNDGNTLRDARMAFPFPIPKTGKEAMWNHKVRWSGSMEYYHYKAYIVTGAGRLINTSEGYGSGQYPYWIPGNTDNDRIMLLYDNNIGPPNRVGEGTMFYIIYDDTKPMPVWSYLPGQRRVKLAPQLAFDNPSTQVAGASTNDDTYIFTGSPRKYDWKLIGKKEMIVPYNQYKAMYWTKAGDFLKPRFINSDIARYEVHRVWVVEATVKPTERHIYKKRVFYLDEDSWQGLMTDIYDHNDKIWRFGWSWVLFSYDVQAASSFLNFGLDFVTQIYFAQGIIAETGGVQYLPNKSDSEWSPAIMAGRGIR